MTFAGHRARKRFGQHWLVDAGVLDRIVAAAELGPVDRVLEVGPGRGALTERLLASPAAVVTAVELDRDLVQGLQQRFGADPRFRLITGDVLEVPLPLEASGPLKVVANIPYNITGPLLERLVGRLERPLTTPYERLVLLVQQEVGERIRAAAGSSAFSALSVRMQLLARCRSVCPVQPRCFVPPPKVMSEVILLQPRPVQELLPSSTAQQVESLLRRCFASRRKMLRNTLAGLLPADALAAAAVEAGLSLQQRPQELAPERWVALATSLNRAGGAASPASASSSPSPAPSCS
jgi:16S rRNA (adenine1518-N6/adenine1519-N6)-dimethyltransferase